MSARDMVMSGDVWVMFDRILVMSGDVWVMFWGDVGSWRQTARALRGCLGPGTGWI